MGHKCPSHSHFSLPAICIMASGDGRKLQRRIVVDLGHRGSWRSEIIKSHHRRIAESFHLKTLVKERYRRSECLGQENDFLTHN